MQLIHWCCSSTLAQFVLTISTVLQCKFALKVYPNLLLAVLMHEQHTVQSRACSFNNVNMIVACCLFSLIKMSNKLTKHNPDIYCSVLQHEVFSFSTVFASL